MKEVELLAESFTDRVQGLVRGVCVVLKWHVNADL
jgi:hypothetical protein